MALNKKTLIVAVSLILLPLVLFILILALTNKGTVNIASVPSGAMILVDGKEKGKSPLEIKGLRAGNHVFSAKKDGFFETKVTKKIKRGDNNVKMTLLPTITSKLPYRGDKFYIEYKPEEQKYKITLFAIINRPSQQQEYIEQLKAYKKQSLDWLKSNGVDIERAQIEYLPPKAKGL